MTLPEVHRLLFINCDDLCFNKCLPVVNQIYYHFEQQIKELEAPKSCDGCRNIGKLMDICCDCSRMWSDKYEQKDK